MDRIVLARIGAVFYVLWGLLHYTVRITTIAHYTAAYNVYQVGLGTPLGMVQGRLFQGAFYLFGFATTAIALAVKMNWNNSRTGFLLNALIVGIADVPFILFVVVPGYTPIWPSVSGPALWVAAIIFTGLGPTRRTPDMRVGIRRRA